MTATLIAGEETWSGGWDVEGYRSYKVKYKVRTDDARDGPCTVLATAGLPIPGALYNIDNDRDLWCWCKFTRTVSPANPSGDNKLWIVECEFGNKPDKRCQDNKIEDPLLQPYEFSVNLTQRNEEATEDRFGQKILSSSHELFQGPPVEFEQYTIVVAIKQNRPLPQIELLYSMNNTVNAFPLWGLPRRTIKMIVQRLERKYWGTCYVYYERELQFHIRKETFDRLLLDEGTKVLSGHWEDGDDCTAGVWVLDNICGEAPDYNDPRHFIRYQDRNGNMTRVILDGFGQPWSPDPPLMDTHSCTAPNCVTGRLVEQWTVRGFILTIPALDGLALAYVSGCQYTGSIGGVTITLDYSHPNARWQLTVSAYPGTIWAIDGTAFNCLGGNLLTNIGTGLSPITNPPGPGPLNIFLEPSGATDPGSVYVEKYDESDFLQLGIPAILQ